MIVFKYCVGAHIIKQHEKISSSVNNLVKSIIKEYQDKKTKLEENLDDSKKFLEELEMKNIQSISKNASLEIEIERYKTQQDDLKKEIKEYDLKITELNDFNVEIIKMLEKLKVKVEGHVKSVKDLKKYFDKERLALEKQIQDLKVKNDKAEKRHLKEIEKKDQEKKQLEIEKKAVKTKYIKELKLKEIENDNLRKQLEVLQKTKETKLQNDSLSKENKDSLNSFHSKHKTKQKDTEFNDDLIGDKPFVGKNSLVVVSDHDIVEQEELLNNKNFSPSLVSQNLIKKHEESKESETKVKVYIDIFNKVIGNSTNKTDKKPADKTVLFGPNKSKIEELKNRLFSSVEETVLTDSKTDIKKANRFG